MDHSYPYIASLTREPFLFYEMRSTAKLMTEGISDDAVVKEIVEQNLFQYPTEKSITRMAKACIKQLDQAADDVTWQELNEYVITRELKKHFITFFLKIYNYPKSQDAMAALHAKVISVDGEKTLITSANLSYHGQQGNIELGTVIDSRDIAKQVEDIFTQLIFKKVFTEI